MPCSARATAEIRYRWAAIPHRLSSLALSRTCHRPQLCAVAWVLSDRLPCVGAGQIALVRCGSHRRRRPGAPARQGIEGAHRQDFGRHIDAARNTWPQRSRCLVASIAAHCRPPDAASHCRPDASLGPASRRAPPSASPAPQHETQGIMHGVDFFTLPSTLGHSNSSATTGPMWPPIQPTAAACGWADLLFRTGSHP